MDRTHRDLMHAMGGHRGERVRNREERKLLLAIQIFPQREYLLRPATMSQPTTLVPGVSSDTEQIIDRALHAPGCRKQTPKIWVRQVCRFKGMSYDKHIINRKISSIYLEATIATAIIGSPQRQQLSTGVTELLRGADGSLRSAVVSTKNSLEKTPNGGIPRIARDPSTNPQPMVGLMESIPRISSMRCVPAAWEAWPAVKKMEDLVSECTVMCSSAAKLATGPATPKPKELIPLFSMEEES